MDTAEKKQKRKSNFEISFNDSPEYFIVKNAKMIMEDPVVRFMVFDGDGLKEDI